MTASAAHPDGCADVEFTVETLHTMVDRSIAEVRRYPESEFGVHILEAEFDAAGVPVVFEFDLANGADEESLMNVEVIVDE